MYGKTAMELRNVEDITSESHDPGSQKPQRQKIAIITFCILSLTSAGLVMIIYYALRSTTVSNPKSNVTPFEAFNSAYCKFKNDSEIIIDEGCDFFGIVGDDICDDIANTKSCGFDFGDCCIHENDRNSCQNCICYIDTTIHNTFLDFACLNKLSMTLMEDWIYARLGDGYCDLESNLKKYDFDLGDCCIDQVDCFNLGNIICYIHTH